MLKNTVNGYGLISMFFHWISVIAVIGLFSAGWWMVELNYYSKWYKVIPHWHKSIGLLFAFLIITRLIWKTVNVSPSPVGSAIEKKIAHIAHGFLYLLMILIFVSGYLISTADGRGIDIFTWFTVPSLGEFIENQEDIAGLVHEYLAYSLMALVSVHALAALKHHFIDKDDVLRRMVSLKKR